MSKINCLVSFLKEFIKKIFYELPAAGFVFSKTPCFHHILMNTFRRIGLSIKFIFWKASYFRHSNNIQITKTSLQEISMDTHQKWKPQSYLGNKDKKAHSGFASLQVKLRTRNTELDEVNLTSPASSIELVTHSYANKKTIRL